MPHPGHPTPSHPGHTNPGHTHQNNPGYNPGHNSSHCFGHAYRGVNHRFWCYRSGWLGWTKRRWCQRLGCWLFWCPGTCWYRYYEVDSIYVPCDDLTNENVDD